MLDERNLDAKRALLGMLPQMGITAATGWVIETEQELTEQDLYVLKLSHPSVVTGHATVEASGYRSGGGHEYLITTHKANGGRGPMSFSYPGSAVHWARTYLLGDAA